MPAGAPSSGSTVARSGVPVVQLHVVRCRQRVLRLGFGEVCSPTGQQVRCDQHHDDHGHHAGLCRYVRHVRGVFGSRVGVVRICWMVASGSWRSVSVSSCTATASPVGWPVGLARLQPRLLTGEGSLFGRAITGLLPSLDAPFRRLCGCPRAWCSSGETFQSGRGRTITSIGSVRPRIATVRRSS
jgi:hypothetical protein